VGLRSQLMMRGPGEGGGLADSWKFSDIRIRYPTENCRIYGFSSDLDIRIRHPYSGVQ